VSQGGQAIKFHETDARSMGRGAAGVIGMRLGVNDRVIAFEVVDPTRDLLVASERGFGKRTSIELFRGQGRGGKGVQAMKLTARTGKIVAAAMVDDDSSVMLMDSKGVVIRIAARAISRLGRSTQGVTLKKLADDERLVAMTVTRNQVDDGLNGVDPAMILPIEAIESQD
jgi:DNA gyrase subunit A